MISCSFAWGNLILGKCETFISGFNSFFFSIFLFFPLSPILYPFTSIFLFAFGGCIFSRAVLTRLLPDIFSCSPQFTSFIVLVVSTRGLHCNTAARSPPACLAFTVPALLPHGALAVPIAQVRTAVCEERTGGQGGKGGRKEEKRGRGDGREAG